MRKEKEEKREESKGVELEIPTNRRVQVFSLLEPESSRRYNMPVIETVFGYNRCFLLVDTGSAANFLFVDNDSPLLDIPGDGYEGYEIDLDSRSFVPQSLKVVHHEFQGPAFDGTQESGGSKNYTKGIYMVHVGGEFREIDFIHVKKDSFKLLENHNPLPISGIIGYPYLRDNGLVIDIVREAIYPAK
jgi:hypothetical protein